MSLVVVVGGVVVVVGWGAGDRLASLREKNRTETCFVLLCGAQ